MQRLILVIGILALVVGTVLYVKSRKPAVPMVVGDGGSGDGKAAGKKNKIAEVDCKTHGAYGNGPAGTAVITVNATDGVALADEGVFVCVGEKVYWEAGAGVQSIDVYFAQADWPFDPSSFVSPLHGSTGS